MLDRFYAAKSEHEAARRLLDEPYVITVIDWGIDSEFGQFGPSFRASLGGQAKVNAASVADQIGKQLQSDGVDARVAVSPASHGHLTITAQFKVDKPADFIRFLCGPGDLNEQKAQ